MNVAGLSIVVIGRNEGDRLAVCFESIRKARKMPRLAELVYVDSHSADGSPALAASYGATVIKLGTGKLTAARARNAGWQVATAPLILFLDGDTILDPDFICRALPQFADESVAVIWGHRRELRPEASIYNRVLDLDWIAHPGDSDFCGGDSLMRREVLERTSGFNPELIAGEEPDLCRRIRGMGGRIVHVDIPMTGHDLAIHHMSQYWRRAVRTGHAYAEIATRYRDSGDPLWTRESHKNLFQGSLYILVALALCVAATLLHSWIPVLLGVIGGAALSLRTAIASRWKGAPQSTLLLFGIHSHLQHVPILLGQLDYFWRRWRGHSRMLIEYKAKSS
jgi:glycosyltransferase involved in cell wall biosynthesis